MRSLLSSLCLILLTSGAAAAWWDGFQRELKTTTEECQRVQSELASLGERQVGNTVPEFGIQHVMLAEPPPESPFVQIDLGHRKRLDTVVLVPAVLDFQGVKQSPYAFPVRFRLDASDDPDFGLFTPLRVETEVDHVLTEVTPVLIRTPGIQAQYLRLTVTKLAQVEGRWTFALAEMMALDGHRNVALGARVTHKGGTGLPPRWMNHHLTDGRTPLGPPLDRSTMPEFDALFASIHDEAPQPWMGLDMGAEMPLDEVRAHPLHARQGADVPGFAFPSRFRIEAASLPDFSDAKVIVETAKEDYPNPGNNAAVFSAEGHTGRYVRFMMLAVQTGRRESFALSELEVYSQGKKVSVGKPVLSSGDPRRAEPRPLNLLTDGHASYGRLLELPEWLAEWERRQLLQARMISLSTRMEELRPNVQQQEWVALITLGLGLVMMAGIVFWRSHRRHVLESEAFRTRLAHDMHDEIGSNLAGIAVISETSAMLADTTSKDWQEINRIAHETTDAMREVLWLVGARQESGIDLMEHLRRVAKRLLPHHEVVWTHCAEDLPLEWPVESRRHVFLFFKEALTNILRHAHATKVTLSATKVGTHLELRIVDNGTGFDTGQTSRGIGLASMRERSRLLGGRCQICSSSTGTEVLLRVPVTH